jgi:hypothetical protein
MERFRESGPFPHEVGFFLGYPPEDVIGFMENNGKGCKLCGTWKVYGDVEKARACFREYSLCRKRLVEHMRGTQSALAALETVSRLSISHALLDGMI